MARTESNWIERAGSYLETSWSEGRNILINGSNKYLNFGSLSGETGYGFRDNGGTIEFKNSGGSWAGVGSGSGSGVTVETPTGTVNASNNSFTVTAEPKYVVADGVTYFDGAGYSYVALTITMDIPPSSYIRAII